MNLQSIHSQRCYDDKIQTINYVRPQEFDLTLHTNFDLKLMLVEFDTNATHGIAQKRYKSIPQIFALIFHLKMLQIVEVSIFFPICAQVKSYYTENRKHTSTWEANCRRRRRRHQQPRMRIELANCQVLSLHVVLVFFD